MDGYEAAGIMRADGYERPIVALTANAMRGFEQRVLAAGFSHYETKPIDIDRLLALLAELVGEALDVPDGAGGGSPGTPVDDGPIPSSLAAANPAFATIATRFLERLDGELATMRDAVAAGDAARVADRAHWLKGSGGTVGYACLGEPAAALELAAKADDGPGMRAAFAAIETLCARLVVLEGDGPGAVPVTKAPGPAPPVGGPAVNPSSEGDEGSDDIAA